MAAETYLTLERIFMAIPAAARQGAGKLLIRAAQAVLGAAVRLRAVIQQILLAQTAAAPCWRVFKRQILPTLAAVVVKLVGVQDTLVIWAAGVAHQVPPGPGLGLMVELRSFPPLLAVEGADLTHQIISALAGREGILAGP